MAHSLSFSPRNSNRSIYQRLTNLNWFMILLLVMVAGIGCAMLYSVAGGQWDPWASRQAMRFGMAFILMLAIAVTSLRFWMAFSYPAYFLGLIMLVAVEFVGSTGMGGMRWLDLGVMRVQPSELMKVAVIMALARYYHGVSLEDARKLSSMIMPLLIILLPGILIIRQPDLGTTILLMAGGISIIFMSGMKSWIFWVGGIAGLASIPIGWRFLRDYQKERVLTFLNPERDPLGAGYQITQAKIAAGSGGTYGKGFLNGTQSHLNFLPEMKTDFIFSVLLEEFGIMGGGVLILLYLILLTYALLVALTCRNQFGRLMAMGLSITLFLYLFINVAMVMGLLPVVGVPLPMVSYGGSAMLTMMIAYGLILAVAINRDLNLPRVDAFGR